MRNKKLFLFHNGGKPLRADAKCRQLILREVQEVQGGILFWMNKSGWGQFSAQQSQCVSPSPSPAIEPSGTSGRFLVTEAYFRLGLAHSEAPPDLTCQLVTSFSVFAGSPCHPFLESELTVLHVDQANCSRWISTFGTCSERGHQTAVPLSAFDRSFNFSSLSIFLCFLFCFCFVLVGGNFYLNTGGKYIQSATFRPSK